MFLEISFFHHLDQLQKWDFLNTVILPMRSGHFFLSCSKLESILFLLFWQEFAYYMYGRFSWQTVSIIYLLNEKWNVSFNFWFVYKFINYWIISLLGEGGSISIVHFGVAMLRNNSLATSQNRAIQDNQHPQRLSPEKKTYTEIFTSIVFKFWKIKAIYYYY